MVILWNFLDALRVRGLQAVVSDARNAKLKSNCLYISNGKFNYYPASYSLALSGGLQQGFVPVGIYEGVVTKYFPLISVIT